uniref:Uncharacterized protein n=1 Tax=Cacopsylla melanoneura TaxID=428564 RepID=A0A8D8QUT0_9HEMI
MYPYCVLKFIKANQVEAVPSKWLKEFPMQGYDNTCYWPLDFRPNMVQKNVDVERKNCQEFEVKVLGVFTSYIAAKMKLPRAEDTSNLDSDEEIDKRQRKRNPKYEDSSSSDDQDVESHFNINSPPKLKIGKGVQRQKTVTGKLKIHVSLMFEPFLFFLYLVLNIAFNYNDYIAMGVFFTVHLLDKLPSYSH